MQHKPGPSSQNQFVNYYEVLQVSPRATDKEIKQAYYKLAKQFHPDRNPGQGKLAELRFRLINEAYASLKSPSARACYNAILRKHNRTRKLTAGNDNGTVSQRNETEGAGPSGQATWMRRTLHTVREILWPFASGPSQDKDTKQT